MLKVEIFEEENITKLKTLEVLKFSINGLEYKIKKGFVSDGMSCPKILWGILSPAVDGITLEPSIKHDYLYLTKITTRLEADQMYKQWLLDGGYSKFKANIVYWGLRLFGGSHW